VNSEADNIIGLYERHAKNWDEDRGSHLFEQPWLDQYVALMPLGSSILDIGCGSGGPIARFLIEHGYRVTGVDSSPSMIDICKRRFPMQEWVVADMRELRLEARCNGIIAWDSFFHLSPEHQRRMFPVFSKHSSSNAALMFTSGPAAGEAIGEYRGEPLYHASLDAAEYRELLERNGFAVISHVEKDATCGDHTVWLARLR
jgi:trans-aconitate methyltransferase